MGAVGGRSLLITASQLVVLELVKVGLLCVLVPLGHLLVVVNISFDVIDHLLHSCTVHTKFYFFWCHKWLLILLCRDRITLHRVVETKACSIIE